MLKVTFNNPQLEEDKEFAVLGLGLIKNGETRELSALDEEMFYAETGKAISDLDNGVFSVEGTPEFTPPEPEPEPEPHYSDEPEGELATPVEQPEPEQPTSIFAQEDVKE